MHPILKYIIIHCWVFGVLRSKVRSGLMLGKDWPFPNLLCNQILRIWNQIEAGVTLRWTQGSIVRLGHNNEAWEYESKTCHISIKTYFKFKVLPCTVPSKPLNNLHRNLGECCFKTFPIPEVKSPNCHIMISKILADMREHNSQWSSFVGNNSVQCWLSSQDVLCIYNAG